MGFFKRLVPLKADIILTIEEKNVDEGRVKGHFQLDCKEAFKVEEIRLEVVVEEHWSSGGKNHFRTLFSDKIHISGPFEGTVGYMGVYPFEVVNLNYNSTHTGGGTQTKLKAVASVNGRPDVTKEIRPFAKNS